MENWCLGQPDFPGWYLLEFSGGDRFVVVRAFYDDDGNGRTVPGQFPKLLMEDQGDKHRAYVNDVVDTIVQHLRIPPVPPAPCTCQ